MYMAELGALCHDKFEYGMVFVAAGWLCDTQPFINLCVFNVYILVLLSLDWKMSVKASTTPMLFRHE